MWMMGNRRHRRQRWGTDENGDLMLGRYMVIVDIRKLICRKNPNEIHMKKMEKIIPPKDFLHE